MRNGLRALLFTALLAAACAPSTTATASPQRADAAPTDNQLNGNGAETSDPSTTTPDVETRGFTSDALARPMPYSIYLPPDYTTSTKRYPVLYMLHGMSGSNQEWSSYGLVDKEPLQFDPTHTVVITPGRDKGQRLEISYGRKK